jgi:hypothetical protein
MDSWYDHLDYSLWQKALADCGVDIVQTAHAPYAMDAKLPWDHLNVKKGRAYLEKEQTRAVVQLAAMAEAK